MPSAARPAKVQRWFDVIAALLLYHYPITFEQLARGVPAYLDPKKKSDALMRMFERDKDELRALGVPIETVAGEDGGMAKYRLSSRNFYLPYLYLDEPGDPKSKISRPSGWGYQNLPAKPIQADELAMIAQAAARVQQLGSPHIAAAAARALRKITFDIPLTDVATREIVIPSPDAPDAAVMETLDNAVRRRKTVEFEYWSIERNARGRRTVEPYGLVFKSGHWYLIARDPAADAVRMFRVNRVSTPAVNDKTSQHHDFTVPISFSPWKHTAEQHAWEFGDGADLDVTVRFDRSDRQALIASSLGNADPDHADCRRFTVRRLEHFTRWLLSFAGAAQPVHPPEIVDAFHTLARAVAALYADDVPGGVSTDPSTDLSTDASTAAAPELPV